MVYDFTFRLAIFSTPEKVKLWKVFVINARRSWFCEHFKQNCTNFSEENGKNLKRVIAQWIRWNFGKFSFCFNPRDCV